MFKTIKLFEPGEYPALLADYLTAKLSGFITPAFKHKVWLINRLREQGIAIEKKYPGIFELKTSLNEKAVSFFARFQNSDYEVFEQVVIKNEYEPLVALINKMGIVPAVLVDGGANAGYTCVYLSAFFNIKKIIAVEPNADIMPVLKLNLSLIEGAEMLIETRGLWNKKTKLLFNPGFRDGKDWSFSLTENAEKGDINVISPKELMEAHGVAAIDILKLDIEGAEAALFSDEAMMTSVLSVTKFIAIEIHDEFHCREKIETVLRKCGFDFFNAGELTIGCNTALVRKA